MILYLAMTGDELSVCPVSNCAYLSCRFSPNSSEITDFPQTLPTGAMLILTDEVPVTVQDPMQVKINLETICLMLRTSALILDFQQSGSSGASEIAKYLTLQFPCKVIVSEPYAQNLNCPVLLSAPPPDTLLKEYLAPWRGREIWMEAAISSEVLTLTESGCRCLSCPAPVGADALSDTGLHCHYKAEVLPGKAAFTLWRTPSDLLQLMQEAEALGVLGFIGLYQQLAPYLKKVSG